MPRAARLVTARWVNWNFMIFLPWRGREAAPNYFDRTAVFGLLSDFLKVFLSSLARKWAAANVTFCPRWLEGGRKILNCLMHARAAARHQRARMTDDMTRQAMRGAGRLERHRAGQPRRQI